MSRITLKNLKTCRGHDGSPAWSASIYVDGKRIGYIRDDSYGGGYQYEPFKAYLTLQKVLMEEGAMENAIRLMAKIDVKCGDMSMEDAVAKRRAEQDDPSMRRLMVDGAIGKLADEYEQTRRMKQQCRKSWVFELKKGDQRVIFPKQDCTLERAKDTLKRHKDYTDNIRFCWNELLGLA